MNLSLLIDKNIQLKAEYLRPHFAIHSLSDLGAFTSNVQLPEVTVSVLYNFVNDED